MGPTSKLGSGDIIISSAGLIELNTCPFVNLRHHLATSSYPIFRTELINIVVPYAQCNFNLTCVWNPWRCFPIPLFTIDKSISPFEHAKRPSSKAICQSPIHFFICQCIHQLSIFTMLFTLFSEFGHASMAINQLILYS